MSKVLEAIFRQQPSCCGFDLQQLETCAITIRQVAQPHQLDMLAGAIRLVCSGWSRSQLKRFGASKNVSQKGAEGIISKLGL